MKPKPHTVLNRSDFAALAANRQRSDRIATRASDPSLSMMMSFLPNPDPILRKLGRREEVLRAICYDSHVAGELVSMASGVKAREWLLLPGGDDPASQRAYQIAQHFMTRRPDPLDLVPRSWADVLWEMYLSRLKGLAIHELADWALDTTAQAVLPRVLEVPARRVVFDPDNHPRLLTRASPMLGEAMDHPRRWALTRHLADADNPYGFALLSAAFWPYTFKHQGMRWWAQFVEKYGIPKAIGKVPAGTPDKQRAEIAEQLAAMVEDAVAVIPNDGSVELMAPPVGGDVLHVRFIDQCNKELSKALRSNTLSIEAQGDGSLAATESHRGREQSIDTGNLGDLAESVNLMLQWVTEVNVAGAKAPYLVWKEEAQVSEAQVRAVDQMRGFLDVTEDFAYEVLKAPKPKLGQKVLPRPVAPAAGAGAGPMSAGADFSSPRSGGDLPHCPHCAADYAAGTAPRDPIDVLMERLGREGESHIEAMYSRILVELKASADLKEAQGRVLDLYPELETSDFARLLGNAFMVAEVRGREAAERG